MDNIINITRRNSPIRFPLRRPIDYSVQEIDNLKNLNKKLLDESKFDNRLLKIFIFLSILSASGLILVSILHFESINNMYSVKTYPNLSNNTLIYVKNNEIHNIFDKLVIKNNHRGFHIMRIEYIMNDNKYILPEYRFIEIFIYNDKTDLQKYSIEKNDCDDFSFIIYGNFLQLQYSYNLTNSMLFGVGYIKNTDNTYFHTVNIFIDNKFNIYCIESQEDTIVLCENYRYGLYRVLF